MYYPFRVLDEQCPYRPTINSLNRFSGISRRNQTGGYSDVNDAAATALGLSDSDRAELLPSGVQAVYKNRAGWAHDG